MTHYKNYMNTIYNKEKKNQKIEDLLHQSDNKEAKRFRLLPLNPRASGTQHSHLTEVRKRSSGETIHPPQKQNN